MLTEEELKKEHPLEYLERVICNQADKYSLIGIKERGRARDYALGRVGAYEEILEIIKELRDL